jgi:15-cis-phytoene synthase
VARRELEWPALSFSVFPMNVQTSFYYSFLVLPPAKREAIVAVWHFCRAVDDTADEAAALGPQGADSVEAALSPHAELARWRRDLAACFGGGSPETEQARRLQPHIARFNLPRAPLEHVIDGVEMDLEPRRYDTFEALYDYCLHVASAVGLVCLEIFGYRDPRSRTYAVDLGVALQLTNILRDIAGDLARGRVYLPQQDLSRFGVSEDDLRAGIVTEKVAALMKFQCDRARLYYQRASEGLPPADRRSLVAARIMGAIYFDILRRIERHGYDVFSSVVSVPRPRRAWLAAGTWAKSMIGA